MWQTGWTRDKRHFQKVRVAYRLYSPEGIIIFEGNDYGVSPMMAPDSDESIRTLMGFLTMRPGDTDDEYFKDYTPKQLTWAEKNADDFYQFTDGEDISEDTEPFINHPLENPPEE